MLADFAFSSVDCTSLRLGAGTLQCFLGSAEATFRRSSAGVLPPDCFETASKEENEQSVPSLVLFAASGAWRALVPRGYVSDVPQYEASASLLILASKWSV